jgi:hypothetical protein
MKVAVLEAGDLRSEEMADRVLEEVAAVRMSDDHPEPDGDRKMAAGR